jgi:hypothetical protein
LRFLINGHAVSQVNDADYASGAVGFYVETFDSPDTHIHYDSLTIQSIVALPTATTGPCIELAVNGDFETDEGWTIANTPYRARYTRALAHTGERSVQLGIVDLAANRFSYSSVQQRFRVPAGAVATLRFWYHMSDKGGNDDHGYFLIRPDGGSWRFMRILTDTTDDWTMFHGDVSQYAGQSVTVHLGTRNDGPRDGAAAVMYVDSFSLQSCTP